MWCCRASWQSQGGRRTSVHGTEPGLDNNKALHTSGEMNTYMKRWKALGAASWGAYTCTHLQLWFHMCTQDSMI